MYNRYSTSEWGGSVPEQWLRIPIKRLFNVVSGATPSSVDPKNWNGSIAWITPADFSNTNRYIVKGKKSMTDIGYRSCGTTIVPQGSIVITKRAPIGNVMIAANELCTNQGCLSLVKKKDINEGYYYFLLSCYSGIFNALGTGTTFKEISLQTFSDFKIPVPSRDEQDQIVRYLDWKTSEINRLIHGLEKEISLLKERRNTIIDIYSTQGVDGAVLKRSNVHWLEKIPAHWNMVYAKKLFSQRQERAYAQDIQLTSSQKYGIISQHEFMEYEGRRVTVVLKGKDILKHVGKGDFVISMRSFQGGIEYSNVEGKISSAYVMLIPNKEKVYSGYYKWLLKSRLYIKALQGTSDLVRDGQALRYANFAKVYLPEVPLDEQKRIAQQIDQDVKKIDDAIPIIEREMELLREYRTRLISDVVTGQMDVRNVKIPDYVPEQDDAENALNETDIGEVDADAE